MDRVNVTPIPSPVFTWEHPIAGRGTEFTLYEQNVLLAETETVSLFLDGRSILFRDATFVGRIFSIPIRTLFLLLGDMK